MDNDYPLTEKAKEIRATPRKDIEDHTNALWDGRGLKVDTITGPKTSFGT